MKVLIVFDAVRFSTTAFDFAKRIGEPHELLLTGVFIPPFAYANVWSFSTLANDPLEISPEEGNYTALVRKNVTHFERACKEHNLSCRVHRKEAHFEIPDLRKETRFADLVVIASQALHSNSGTPSQYIRELLYTAECPVLVVPESAEYPHSTILAYDGSPSSVYALKQFTYLFPDMRNNKTLLVYANDESQMPEESLVKELVENHFPDITLFKLDVEPGKYFATWVSEKKTAMLVAGSFGRSFLSNIFKKSFVSDVIREHSLPVFIAHR